MSIMLVLLLIALGFSAGTVFGAALCAYGGWLKRTSSTGSAPDAGPSPGGNRRADGQGPVPVRRAGVNEGAARRFSAEKGTGPWPIGSSATEPIPASFWREVEFNFDPFNPPPVGTKVMVWPLNMVAEYMGEDEEGCGVFKPLYTNLRLARDDLDRVRSATRH